MAGGDVYIGQILTVPFNFAPTGFAFCNGQLLAISQNTALFSLLGTYYGGDGKSTFALPNLQGRVPIHTGQGPGLSDRTLGESDGAETHTLTTAELPAHTHSLTSAIAATARGRNAAGDSTTPVGAAAAISAAHAPAAFSSAAADSNMGAGAVAINTPPAATPTGGSGPHNNLAPYLTLNFVIALTGVFPPRN